jgi:hypothetical protein
MRASHDRIRAGRDGRDRATAASVPVSREQRIGIAGEAPNWAQRDMADNSCDPEGIVFDQLLGQFLVEREVGANESGDVIDRTADLPAFDNVVDSGEAPLKPDLPGLALQDDLGKNVDGRDRAAMSMIA